MVLDRTMSHFRNPAATWLDQAQRNNLPADCSLCWNTGMGRTEGLTEEQRTGGREDGSGAEERVGRSGGGVNEENREAEN